MTTEIMAAGTTAATSAAQNVPAGKTHTIILKPAAGKLCLPLSAVMVLQLENADEAFIDAEPIATSKKLDGPLDYRLRRPAQAHAIGADVKTE